MTAQGGSGSARSSPRLCAVPQLAYVYFEEEPGRRSVEKVSDSTGLLYCAAAIYSQPALADYTADAQTVYYQRPPRRR